MDEKRQEPTVNHHLFFPLLDYLAGKSEDRRDQLLTLLRRFVMPRVSVPLPFVPRTIIIKSSHTN